METRYVHKQKHQNHTSEKGQDPDFPQPEDRVGLSSPHGRLLLWDHLSWSMPHKKPTLWLNITWSDITIEHKHEHTHNCNYFQVSLCERENFKTNVHLYPNFMTSSNKIRKQVKPFCPIPVRQAFKIFRWRINTIRVIKT